MKVLRVKSVNGDTSFQDVTLQVNGYKKYILVAAINYDTSQKYSFIQYCNDYKSKIEKKIKMLKL